MKKSVYTVYLNRIRGHRVHIDIKPNGSLYYRTSLPHLIHGTSYYDIKEADQEKCLKIFTKLKESGLVFDEKSVCENPLSRINYCKNIQVDHPVSDYINYLSQFDMSRHKKIHWAQETLYFKNQQRELIIYDKVKSINTQIQCISERPLIKGKPENILRMEVKFKKKQMIERHLGRLTLSNIFDQQAGIQVLQKELDQLHMPYDFNQELDLNNNNRIMDNVIRIRPITGFSG